MATPASTPVIVQTKPAWQSRINQIAVAVFGLAVPIGTLTPFLPEPWKSRSIAAVSVIGAFAVWYYKTFQTTSITPSSAATLPSATDVMRASGASETQITNALNASQLPKVKP